MSLSSFIKIGVVVFFFSCNSTETSTSTSTLDTSGTGTTITSTVAQPGGAEQTTINVDNLPADSVGRMLISGALQPGDNAYTYRMMDSLLSDNRDTRRFYFGVFNKIMDHASGALGDAIGDYVLTFVEQYPADFISFSRSYTQNRFDVWASHAGIELSLSSNNPTDSYQKFSQGVLARCSQCSSITKNRLRLFNKLVWQTMKATASGRTDSIQ